MEHEFIKVVDFIREIYHKPEGVIHLHEPVFTGNEINYVKDCILSTYVSSIGEYVNKFERRIADYTNAGYAVAAVNGTAEIGRASCRERV